MESKGWSTCTSGDPKFWPAYVRHMVLLNVCVFVFLGNMYTAGLATGFVELATEFHVDFAKLTDTISYPVLALGVGNLFWTPTAVCFGKRPTIIVSAAIFLACSIWSIYAPTLDSLIASRVVACFAAGSIESIGPAIIADIYMERYFATSMAVFSLSLSGGSQIGPMVAGFLISARGWRWFFILCAILIGANLFLMMFLLPETNFRRVLFEGETAQEVDKQAVEMLEHSEKNVEATPEAQTLQVNVPYAGSYWKDLVNLKNRGTEERGIWSWPRQFSLPFRFLLVPHVLFATLAYGVFLGGVVMVSTLAPQLLSPPPYLFSSSSIGLFSLSSFIGILLAYPIAGPLTDLLSRVVAGMSHSREHKPENRMPSLIVPFIIAPPGLLLFAYILTQQGNVYAAAAGSAMSVSSMVFVPSVVLSVVVDAWPSSGSEALVLINAGKNLVGFGITLSTSQWLASEGLVKMFWEMAGIQWAVLALGLPLFFFGPLLRRSTMWLV